MNKIRIIDLLNKIAKGENPKKIKYYDDIYEFDCYEGEWGYVNKEHRRYKWFAKEIDCDLQEQLNDEVEIIEEDKKIEKMIKLNNISNPSDMTALCTMQWENNKIIEKKIDEIINYINEGDK